MAYTYLGATQSPVTVMQTTLKELGYLQAKDVDGLYGPTTMLAVVRLGLDTITDFASSLNSATGEGGRALVAAALREGDADVSDPKTVRDLCIKAYQGAQKLLASTLVSDGRGGNKFAMTSAALDSVKQAQARIKEYWSFWSRANGRKPPKRAAMFIAMNISSSGGSKVASAASSAKAPAAVTAPTAPTEPASPAAGGLSPKVLIGVGVGLAALLLVMAMSKKGGRRPAVA